jgi:hypothetical protein
MNAPSCLPFLANQVRQRIGAIVHDTHDANPIGLNLGIDNVVPHQTAANGWSEIVTVDTNQGVVAKQCERGLKLPGIRSPLLKTPLAFGVREDRAYVPAGLSS